MDFYLFLKYLIDQTKYSKYFLTPKNQKEFNCYKCEGNRQIKLNSQYSICYNYSRKNRIYNCHTNFKFQISN
jgi:plasmid maintenance system killer protein